MPPTIILIRHAQALHNVADMSPQSRRCPTPIYVLELTPDLQNWQIPDPELTDLGRSQCKTLNEGLKKALPGKLEPDLIITSPLRRCCETTMLGLDWMIEKGVPVIADAKWQEIAEFPCDTGSSIPTLAAEFPAIDFSKVDPVWPDKTSPTPEARYYAYTRAALLRRAQDCLRDLYNRPEKVIAVCTHSGFLRQALTGYWFFNADYRVFDLVAPADETAADGWVVKTRPETLDGGLGLSGHEMMELGEGLPDEDKSVPAQ